MGTRINHEMDCRWTDKGPVIWWARTLKPGDRCRRWCFWTIGWKVVTVKKNRQEDRTIEIEKPGGSDFESYYRLRPLWWPWALAAYVALSWGPIVAKTLGLFPWSWWVALAPMMADTAIWAIRCILSKLWGEDD